MAASSVVRIIKETLSPSDARYKIMEELKEPVVFTNMLKSSVSWEKALALTPQTLASLVPNLRTKFKICPRLCSKEYEDRFIKHETVFETQCTFVEATFGDFCEWLEQPSGIENNSENIQYLSNGLLKFPKSNYWVYADYKYLCNLLAEAPELDKLTDWSIFGIGMETWDSTLWVGSDEAYTPCHCDTYGCNLVAQLSGKKRWLLFPPKDTQHLYPTRIPYEESSIFSKVNIQDPDYKQHPSYSCTTPYKVMLSPGEVLFVPRHWWHHVTCIEPSVSVNVWIPLASDARERVKEGMVRTMTGAVMTSSNDSDWLNPTEEIFPFDENLRLLGIAVKEEISRQQSPGDIEVTASDIINVFCHPTILEQACQLLIEQKRQDGK